MTALVNALEPWTEITMMRGCSLKQIKDLESTC